VNWHIAMMHGKRRALNLKRASGPLLNAAEKVKAGQTREGSIPWLGQEHSEIAYDVCSEQPLNGSQISSARNDGIGPSEIY
jgi:hypothetical protein